MRMFAKLLKKFKSTYTVSNYCKIFPYVKPYWVRGLLGVLITITIGSIDALIAWSLPAESAELFCNLSEFLGLTEIFPGTENHFV